MSKFVYICNSDGALFKFRYPLIKSLIEEGHEVHTISSPSSPEGSFIEQLKSLGVITHTLNFDGRNASVLHAITLIRSIKKILLNIQPEYIHCFTHKGNVLGGIANFLTGLKNKMYFSITGAGLIYTEQTVKLTFAKIFFNFIYKLLSFKVDKVFFQNTDDMELFVKNNVFEQNKVCVTNGSGLDVNSIHTPSLQDKEKLKETYASKDKIVVLYPSRALYEKGVKEFYTAANFVANLSDKFTFIHLGSPADTAVSGYQESDLNNSSNVHYLGHKKSIYEYIEIADVVVLPSYREGTPRAIIESLFFDKYIITTNAPGCRETLIDGWNGTLIEPRNINSLIAALMKLESIDFNFFNGRSKLLFDKKYDSSHIVKQTFEEYFQ